MKKFQVCWQMHCFYRWLVLSTLSILISACSISGSRNYQQILANQQATYQKAQEQRKEELQKQIRAKEQRQEEKRQQQIKSKEQQQLTRAKLESGDEILVHEVSVALRNIDDLGLLIIRNAEGTVTVREVEWKLSEGANEGPITTLLKPGLNLVMFALHNKSFSYGRGKWSYDFTLLGDHTTLWHEADKQAGGDTGIRYWIAFNVESLPNGMFAVKKTSKKQIALIEPDIANLNNQLIKNRGQETYSHKAAGVAAIVVGVFAAAASSSRSGNATENTTSNGLDSSQQQIWQQQQQQQEWQQQQQQQAKKKDLERRQEEVRDENVRIERNNIPFVRNDPLIPVPQE